MKAVKSNSEFFWVSRPELNVLPPIELPFYPRSTGYSQREPGWSENIAPGVKNFVQIFWSVSGTGRMITECGNFLLKPGDFWYRMPGQPHHFVTVSDQNWCYRWLVFDGVQAADFMASYHYPAAPFAAGCCPDEYFLNFRNYLYLRTPYSWRMMCAEVCRILAVAGGRLEPDTPQDRLLLQALELCRLKFQDINFNVNALAAELGVGRTTLNQLFQRHINTTPGIYISRIRIQEALSLLRDTTFPLAAIARHCGFEDVNYFCRFFKRYTGERPSARRGAKK